MPQVSLIKTESYDPAEVERAVARHFELLGVGAFSPDARVTVKPNLIMRCPPERTATTHPAVIEAVVRQLQARGARRLTIADRPGGLYTPQILSAAYEATGMAAVAGCTGASLNLSAGSRNVHVAEGALCRDFDVIDPVADADFVVNCCKLKTHCMTTLSCGVKNLFGCVPGLLKPQLHYRFPDGEQFARMLVDLSLLVKPGLTVADAVDAMEGDGPTGGRRRHVGLTAAARYDGLYALDLVLAGLIGLGPDRVPMLAEAVRRGLCPDGVSGVELLGDPLPPVIEDFLMPASKKLNFSGSLPGPLAKAVDWLEPRLAPRPKVRERDCVGCGRCAESCPAKTIAVTGGKAKIGYAKCIRCFCCHEMCPVRAIDIRSVPVFRFLSKGR